MAVTFTPRFGLIQWGDPSTDGPTMAEFDTAFASLEAAAAFDGQGATISSRPAAGHQGNYFTDLSTGITYRDNGTTWVQVGQATTDATVKNTVIGNVPLNVIGIAGTTAKLQQWTIAGSTNPHMEYGSDGKLTLTDNVGKNVVVVGTPGNPLNVSLSSLGGSDKGVIVNALAAFAGTNLSEWQNNGSAVADMDKTGKLTLSALEANSIQSDQIAVHRTGAVISTLTIAHWQGGATTVSATPTDRMLLNDKGTLLLTPPLNTDHSGGLVINSPDGTPGGAGVGFHAISYQLGGSERLYVDGQGNLTTLFAVNGFIQPRTFTNEASAGNWAAGTMVYLTNPTGVGYSAGVFQSLGSGVWVPYLPEYFRAIYRGTHAANANHQSGLAPAASPFHTTSTNAGISDNPDQLTITQPCKMDMVAHVDRSIDAPGDMIRVQVTPVGGSMIQMFGDVIENWGGGFSAEMHLSMICDVGDVITAMYHYGGTESAIQANIVSFESLPEANLSKVGV